MSRCFPFPPPGYEKKPGRDDIDLLAKEKCKEKKHKKDKRDKEKREGKERKDKDRSRDKHKEKDRKEKHKEKKRDKDRDKGKTAAADDIKFEERTKGHNEEKLGDGRWKVDEVKNSKVIEEFDRRVKDGAAERLVENFACSIPNGIEGFGASIGLEKERGNRNEMAADLIAKEPRRNYSWGQQTETYPDREIEGKEKAKDRYEMHANLVSKEQRRNDGMGPEVENDAEKVVEAKEKVKDRHEMVANLLCKEQRRDNGMSLTVEKDADKKIEGKEKAKDEAHKKIVGKEKATDGEANVAKGDKHKSKGREKRHKARDKDGHKDKEKNREEKRKKAENKHKEHDKTKDSGKKDQIDNLIIKPSVPQKDNEKCAGTDETIKKRKDFETNGFLHDIDGLPNKLPRPLPSSHWHVENKRTLESCHVAAGYSSIKRETTNNINAERVLDTKERKINGVVGPPTSTADLRPSVSVETSQNGKAYVKPPHRDTKFLSQIYFVPKMEEWPEYDDQDWLFSSDPIRLNSKAMFGAEETPQVWAKAQRIESEDVFALPYVIPY